MADYYEVLGLNRNADSTQIRTAYKRLAMQYHPDRNPGNPQAEEIFKVVNEAYHILSDPLKKSRYDSRLNSQHTGPVYTEAYWREVHRKQYAQWQHAQKKRYVFDKNYFKIQGLAFLVFLVMSGICFGIIHTTNYYIALQYEEKRQQNHQLIMEVNALFGAGKIDEAITRIVELHKKEPLEFQFSNARDSLVNELRNQAEEKYTEQKFDEALVLLKHLKKYELLPRLETLRKISTCEYNLGAYESALQSFKQLHNQQPWNLELVFQIGNINYQHLGNKDEALYYYTLGKKIFKENLSSVYGEAFEVVMDPKDAPDIYFEIFIARAHANMDLKNYTEAEKDLNWAIFLRPQQSEPYKLRALAKVKSRNYSLLCKDLDQARKLGAQGIAELQNLYCR